MAGATEKGSFFSSRTYSAEDEFPDTPPLDTFKRLNIYVLKDGWRINQADRELGTISASQDVAGSEGKQTSLNIIVEPLGVHGSKASATFQIGFGQAVIGVDVLKGMCGMLSGTGKPGAGG
ncbi:MAG: hypothetical protein WDM91_04565 [Rhizomicrobium sp.]